VLCLWSGEGFTGDVIRIDPHTPKPRVCYRWESKAVVRSFANNATDDITLYSSAECSTERDFRTYPGGGTYVPNAPYSIRGLETWD
jgi:hypothetical protein